MKQTKRQLKASKAPNAMVDYSRSHGDLITLAMTNSQYKGRTPQYAMRPVNPKDPLSPMHMVQTAKGIPFVRVG